MGRPAGPHGCRYRWTGTTDIAVISLGVLLSADSCAVGGDKFDESIIRYVRQEHNLMIGERTAEDIKIRIGSVCPGSPGDTAEIRGERFCHRVAEDYRPYPSEEACQALSEPVTEIIGQCKGSSGTHSS